MNEKSRIKTAIQQIVREMISSEEIVSIKTEDIIAALRGGHQTLIKELTDQLVDQQLTRYVGSVIGSTRRVGRGASLLDLIADEENLPVIYTLKNGEKKRLEDLTGEQIGALAAKEQKARQAAQNASPLQLALVEFEKAGVSSDVTLGQLVRSGS